MADEWEIIKTAGNEDIQLNFKKAPNPKIYYGWGFFNTGL